MTLRLPDHVKARVEEAASQQGVSVNAWLVRAISAALEPGAGSQPAAQPRSGRSFTGWVR
jgi:predicted transcriptional regulator